MVLYRQDRDPKPAGTVSERYLFATQCDPQCCSPISKLLSACSPTDIARLVVAVVVWVAVDAVPLGWPSPHVTQKPLEAALASPFWADTNASGTVEAEVRSVRVVASLVHPGPAPILGSRSHSVLSRPCAAPACCCMALAKEVRLGCKYLSAVASALKEWLVVLCEAVPDYRHVTVAVPRNINRSRHAGPFPGETSARFRVWSLQVCGGNLRDPAAVTSALPKRVPPWCCPATLNGCEASKSQARKIGSGRHNTTPRVC